MTEPDERPQRTIVLRWIAPLGVAMLFFIAIAPTLTWLEFSNGSENLNVATVLDTRRDGRWLVPRLQGEVRTQKPPLTAWLTGAAVRESSFSGLSSRDADVREQAPKQLAWDVRWTALASMCAMLMAVYGIGRTIGDETVGLVAALACGSSFLVLRQERFSTTDVQLALWVAVTNLGLVKAVVGGRWWSGCVVAGVALGLAIMSKGPVAIVQTLAPAAAFVAWRSWAGRDHARSAELRVAPIVTALLLAVVIGFAWFVLVLLSSGSASSLWARWMSELTRQGATETAPSRWYNYILIVPFMFPWVVFLVVGLILTAQTMARRLTDPKLFASFMLIVPLVLMSFFRDREERYLLPMAGPAALVAAWGVREHLRTWSTWTREDTIVITIHWLALAVIAIGLPIAGAANLEGIQAVDGRPWYTPGFAAAVAVLAAALIAAGVLLHRRWQGGMMATTVAVMLLTQTVIVYGYRKTEEGRSEMKPLAASIWREAPDAIVWSGVKNRRVPADLSIYLDREIVTHPDPETIAPIERPQVLILYQRKRTGPPVPPPGWTLLDTANRDGNIWWAYLMP